jgi:LPXTG-motif cell wall-anchored protein
MTIRTLILAAAALVALLAASPAMAQQVDEGCTAEYPISTPDGCKQLGASKGNPCGMLTGQEAENCYVDLGIKPIPASPVASASAAAEQYSAPAAEQYSAPAEPEPVEAAQLPATGGASVLVPVGGAILLGVGLLMATRLRRS